MYMVYCRSDTRYGHHAHMNDVSFIPLPKTHVDVVNGDRRMHFVCSNYIMMTYFGKAITSFQLFFSTNSTRCIVLKNNRTAKNNDR